MTVKELMNELEALDPSMLVVIEGRKLKSVEWDTFYDESTGDDYQVVNFVLETPIGDHFSGVALNVIRGLERELLGGELNGPKKLS